MGLGSIVGTGIFVSIGVAAGVAGPSIVLAIVIAGGLAVCNALSSAQLAANHPTSGGTYEFGYAYLTPSLGFSAGWLFLCAKSASAATAALGCAGYACGALALDGAGWRRALALAVVMALVGLVLSGVRRSNRTNIVIVSITIAALLFFVGSGLPTALREGAQYFTPFLASPRGDDRAPVIRLLEAAALMFVAYTGYGRIATMGEEVRAPRRTIPQAIVLTLVVSIALYVAVAAVGIGAVGASRFGVIGSDLDAPLLVASRALDIPGLETTLTVGAVTAMLGVLLNLVLGLSRVVLAMGRRGDLPHGCARLNAEATTPVVAVLLVGVLIAGLTMVGSITLAWSFSAFTVLIYYAITNLAAIRLPRSQRLYHPAIAWIGLFGCLSLAFWVEPRIWMTGLALLAVGLVLRIVFKRA